MALYVEPGNAFALCRRGEAKRQLDECEAARSRVVDLGTHDRAAKKVKVEPLVKAEPAVLPSLLLGPLSPQPF